MRFLGFAFLFLAFTQVKAQFIQGKVEDPVGKEIKGALVSLIDSNARRTIAFTITKEDGKFTLPLPRTDSGILFILNIQHIGFMERRKVLDLVHNDHLLITLIPAAKMLNEIVVHADIPIQFRGDTTTFKAQKFLSAEDRKLVDLFRKIPGFSVDEKGKLSYKGDVVEKLFIDGDDPAGFNYNLLTKNASVDFVDKVEVMEHFDDNRLMRNVRRTDKVAVNIITKEEFRMRLSGTADIGLSTSKQKQGDLTTSIFGKKVKQLNFVTANNAGQNLDENYDGTVYQSIEDKLAEMHSNDDDYVNIVSINNVFAPNVDNRLILHNNDWGAASVMSWKLGEHTRMNGQFGLRKTSQWIQKNTFSKYNLGGNDFWETDSKERQEFEDFKVFSTFSFKKDKGGNNISNGYLMLNSVDRNDAYRNVLAGSVNDSLAEGLFGKSWLYSANWTYTKRIDKKVMRFIVNSERNDGQQHYTLQTLRLLRYFKLDSAYSQYQQNSLKRLNNHSVDIKINGKIKNHNTEMGWKTAFQQSDTRYIQDTYNGSNTDRIFLNKANLLTRLFSSYIYGRSIVKISKKSSLSVLTNMGMGSLKIDTMVNILPEFLSSLLFNRSINKKIDISLGGDWSRSFTNWSYFLPDKILVGDARFRNGLIFSGPSDKFSVHAALQSWNITKYKGLILNFSYTKNRFIYGSSSQRFPEYSITGYERYRNYSTLMLLASQSLFLRFIKSKLKINVSLMDSKAGVRINNQFAEQRNKTGFLNGELNTGFNLPINMNLEGSIQYSAYEWNQNGKVSNLQYTWSSKIRYTVNKKIYMAGRWKYYNLSDKRGFNSVDYYVLWNISKKFDLGMEAINLLNIANLNERIVDAISEYNSSFLMNRRFLLFTISCSF